jgi:hypothetical protein
MSLPFISAPEIHVDNLSHGAPRECENIHTNGAGCEGRNDYNPNNINATGN